MTFELEIEERKVTFPKTSCDGGSHMSAPAHLQKDQRVKFSLFQLRPIKA